MPRRYVPLLRSKLGEVQALAQLTNHARGRLLPVMHLTPAVSGRFVRNLGGAWTGHPLAVDGMYNYQVTGSTAEFTSIHSGLERHGVHVMPSVAIGAPTPYLSAVQRAIAKCNRGLLVKSSLGDLQNVSRWSAAQGWALGDIDLVIDAGHLANFHSAQIQRLVQFALQNDLPTPTTWRSVTLASAAAPKDLGQCPRGRSAVARLDWLLWNGVFATAPCSLDYGDFGIAHPDLTEPPGIAAVRSTVSVRYTVDNEWIVLKGVPIAGRIAQPMDRQFRAHARALTQEAGFGGLGDCAGDQRIQQIAVNTGGPGNRQTWVEIAMNRHISLVADRLP